MLEILVCRVAWMPYYQSDNEAAAGGGAYVEEGEVPHESLNFLPVEGTYYGFVQYAGGNLGIGNLGAAPNDDQVDGVLVVFCARQPDTDDFLVVGWYEDATVYRQRIPRPGDDALHRQVSFTTNDATLVAESERCFRMPLAGDPPPNPIGGVGMAGIWYGLSTQAAHDNQHVQAFRDELIAYVEGFGADGALAPEDVEVESRQRRLSERLERRGNNRRFIDVMGYECEACGWSIGEHQRAVWGSSFELHHLTPIHELQPNVEYEVGVDDFAVLCASCHRAIHRTEFVADVAGFAEAQDLPW